MRSEPCCCYARRCAWPCRTTMQVCCCTPLTHTHTHTPTHLLTRRHRPMPEGTRTQRRKHSVELLPELPQPLPGLARRQEQTSRRVCMEEVNYVDEKTGQCKECSPLTGPVLIFLAYTGSVALVLFLLYMLLSKSSWVLKRSAQATRWVTAAHARSFGRQGPSKFRV